MLDLFGTNMKSKLRFVTQLGGEFCSSLITGSKMAAIASLGTFHVKFNFLFSVHFACVCMESTKS